MNRKRGTRREIPSLTPTLRKQKEEKEMNRKICYVSKPNRKKAGKFGKALCPHCYPAGSKRRAEAEHADAQIQDAILMDGSVPDIMDFDNGTPEDDLWQLVYMIGSLFGNTDVDKAVEVFELLHHEIQEEE